MRLFLECKPDETLALAPGVSPRAIVHGHGKGRVANYLAKRSGVTGLVDEDPGSAEPISFRAHAEDSFAHDVRLRVNPASTNRLIVLCPRLEPWLIKTAKTCGIHMPEFGLSENLRDLDAEINDRLPNLQRFIRRLLDLKNERLDRLQSLLASI